MELTEFERAIVANDLPKITRFLDDDPGLVNRADDKGRTPIDLAVSRSSDEVVEMMIQRGAVINKRESVYGSYPMLQAVARDRKEIVEILLCHGVDLALKDYKSVTAYEHAVDLGRTAIADMLRAAQKE